MPTDRLYPPAGTSPAGSTAPPTRRELTALAAILAVAAAVRFVDLPTRGMWDADQGHDLLVLLDWARAGTVPLLGPPTSTGAFHHGALYYWLLAPAALVSDADPTWVVATIALAGTAAVAVVWWLGRAIGGPAAGLIAAGLMAVSAAAIESSTFIWNPNLTGLGSATALAGAWQAWRSERVRWWIVAAAGLALTMQAHVLGVILAVPLAALLALDARRRSGPSRMRLLQAGLAGVAVIGVSYLPLLVHELQTGFGEVRGLLGMASEPSAAGETAGGPSPVVALLVIAVRALSWPLSGLLTHAPLVGLTAAALVIAILAWRSVGMRGTERTASRWLAATLGWGITALALVAPGLASVTPGLPNDHYHAFLDPVVFTVVGIGAATASRHSPAARASAAVVVGLIVAWNVAIWPPPRAEDGGYPAAERAAARIRNVAPEDRFKVASIPAFKDPASIGFPLLRLGATLDRRNDFADEHFVISCDRLFDASTGRPCGGAAEEEAVRESGEAGRNDLLGRFELSPRTVISIYR